MAIGTADFQPIEIFFQHDVDDVSYPFRKDHFCLELQIVCREDKSAINSFRDYVRATRANRETDYVRAAAL